MKLALIDDHKLVHDGFKRLIETEKDWQVICQADSYQSAIDVLHQHQNELSIAIVDISLPDKNGIELAKYCAAQFPALKIIVVSMYDHNPYVANALDAGVKGYISKRAASDELLTGIEKVAAGDTYLSQDVINKLHFNDGNR
ncbi:DNA-binding response regulator [Thalassotalea euphylliae]|uniref:DNA-binding response regulator n=1 Tax=Thalassotalea euphylliae TaxID=1655234 RepID=A0A3E0TWA1_9GAMM|nr:response regulator transcription factor [Thalassotalea euphylliae]REL28212.1 DNA-binding response regulator [Thalassotalea euphylliae]